MRRLSKFVFRALVAWAILYGLAASLAPHAH